MTECIQEGRFTKNLTNFMQIRQVASEPSDEVHNPHPQPSHGLATAACVAVCCQIVSAKEIRRILSNAEVQRLPLPELRSCSKILENHHIQQVEDLCFVVCE